MSYPNRLALLKTLEAELRRQTWFGPDWKILTALWPDDVQPTCAMFQLFKSGWFNDDTCGIHIETWLTDAPVEEQKIPVLMHVLHKKTFPGGQDANAVSKPLVHDPDVQKMVKGWKGYKLGNGGMTPFRANKKFTEDTVVGGLAAEFGKVQEIGWYVDKYLAQLAE